MHKLTYYIDLRRGGGTTHPKLVDDVSGRSVRTVSSGFSPALVAGGIGDEPHLLRRGVWSLGPLPPSTVTGHRGHRHSARCCGVDEQISNIHVVIWTMEVKVKVKDQGLCNCVHVLHTYYMTGSDGTYIVARDIHVGTQGHSDTGCSRGLHTRLTCVWQLR